MLNNWNKTNDYYDRNHVTCDVWSKQITQKITIYLQDGNNLMYTFSCGANSDYSFSGSFYNTTVKTLDQAREWLDKFAPLWFDDKAHQQRKALKQSIEIVEKS